MIIWITDADLGPKDPNIPLSIKLEATSNSIVNERIFYTIIDGILPSGLVLNLNGTLTGKINATISNISEYKFTVKAQGITSLDYSSREFKIEISSKISYLDIKAKAFLSNDQRKKWDEFINNEEIFISTHLYNYNDLQFGINKSLEILICAGIENTVADKYISAIGLNHKKKQFQFGNINIAKGILSGKRDPEYEVIYVEILDPLEYNNKILPEKISAYPNQKANSITSNHDNDIYWTRDINKLNKPAPNWNRINPNIDSSTSQYVTSDPNSSLYFPSSISNWRKRILRWQENTDSFLIERNFLPLWMRTIQFQNNQYQELGYIPALVLCYCLPNKANQIMRNIQNYMNLNNFNFNQFNFTVDRFIIDNKYYIFNPNVNAI